MGGIFLAMLLADTVFLRGGLGAFELLFAFGFAVLAPVCYLFLVVVCKGIKRTLPRLMDYSTMYHAVPFAVQWRFFIVPAFLALVIGLLGMGLS